MKIKHIMIVTALTFAGAMMSCSTNESNSETPKEEVTPWMPKEAMVTTSGLGVIIQNPGDSVRATPESEVTVHYRGRLTNGTVFDSSYDRGEPAKFSVSGVVPGFAEGLQMIGNGGKATLYIPSDLGYGAKRTGSIPPNSNLIFDIEIIEIAQ